MKVEKDITTNLYKNFISGIDGLSNNRGNKLFNVIPVQVRNKIFGFY